MILKSTVPPTLTLIEVANPWIVESPIPFTCQSEGGSPGLVFSQATLFVTGTAQGSAAAAGPPVSQAVSAIAISTTGARRAAPRFLILE